MKFIVPAIILVVGLLVVVVITLVSGWANPDISQFPCTAQTSSDQINYVVNGGFENRSSNWWLTAKNDTTVVTTADPHCGRHALELITVQNKNSSGVGLNQWINQSGCNAGFGRTFGLAMRPGLQLVVWHRTPNGSENRFGVTVTFHNGTSKLSIIYLLAYRGVPAQKMIDKGLIPGGFVNIVINSSRPVWQRSTFDLYGDFVKYFDVDPTPRHYCVNYIALWQEPLGFSSYNHPPAIYVPGSRSYSFFDDVALYPSAHA